MITRSTRLSAYTALELDAALVSTSYIIRENLDLIELD